MTYLCGSVADKEHAEHCAFVCLRPVQFFRHGHNRNRDVGSVSVADKDCNRAESKYPLPVGACWPRWPIMQALQLCWCCHSPVRIRILHLSIHGSVYSPDTARAESSIWNRQHAQWSVLAVWSHARPGSQDTRHLCTQLGRCPPCMYSTRNSKQSCCTAGCARHVELTATFKMLRKAQSSLLSSSVLMTYAHRPAGEADNRHHDVRSARP